jgi:hypothetical protein
MTESKVSYCCLEDIMGEQILKQNENLRALNGVSQQSLK